MTITLPVVGTKETTEDAATLLTELLVPEIKAEQARQHTGQYV